MSASSSKTDEELMQDFQLHGNSDAFNALYARYNTVLYGYLKNRIGGNANVDELFQDIWTNIIKAHYQEQSNASFRTWLFTIARNRTTDFYRRTALRAMDTETNESDPVDFDSPDEQLSRSQHNQSILAAMQQLPIEQRDVFLLKTESGLSLQDIANVTGDSFEATKSRYRYAVKKLSQILDT